MAHRTRPQLASLPNIAALNRELEATDIARVSACFSSRALTTVETISRLAPSPSEAIITASSRMTVSSA